MQTQAVNCGKSRFYSGGNIMGGNIIDTNPVLKKEYEKALKDKVDILEDLKPLREMEARGVSVVQKAEAELKKIRKKIVEKEGTRLAECSKIIRTLAPNQVILKNE